MNRYVIKATGHPEWRSFEGCEIGISIGNPNHEGDKFRSIVQWADKRFGRCIITLSDTLNRYTMMCDGMNEANAYVKTRNIGTQWIEQNRDALESAANAELILNRWDDWLNHPDYERIFQQLMDFRSQDSGLQQALTEDATTYLSRRKNRDEAFDYDRAFQNSLNFFVEEIACYILIGRTYGALRAYPARDMNCFAYMRKPHIPQNLKGLEKAPHIELNFKKKIKVQNIENQRAA